MSVKRVKQKWHRDSRGRGDKYADAGVGTGPDGRSKDRGGQGA